MPLFYAESSEDWGAFYTPKETADFIVRLANPQPGEKVLEPAAGNGIFLDALLDYGVAPADITAWEIDPEMVVALKDNYPGIKIEHRDALLDRPEQEFNVIVGNPPYLNKQSEYIRHHKQELRRIYGKEVGASETYAMFFALSLDLLAAGGRISLLISDTIRSLTSHEKLRRRIAREAPLTHLVRTPNDLFPEATVKTAILVCKKGEVPAQISVMVANSEDDYSGRFRQIPRKVFDQVDGMPFLLEAPSGIVSLFKQPGRLFDYVDSHIGMHTRDNKHCLAALKGSHLADLYDRRRQESDSYRVISAKEAKSDRWKPYLKRGGEQDFWAEQVEFVDWSQANKYVIPSGPLFGKEGLAVSGISKRLSVRLMPKGCYWDTNKVIGMIPKNSSDRYWLLGLLNSDLYSYLARRVISETSSLQLSDLAKLPVPDLDPGQKHDIARLAKQCVAAHKKGEEGPRQELNQVVNQAIGLSAADIRALKAWARQSGISSFC